MGGGGVKGLAHVGAWRAIEESGIQVSEVVGTSIGALVGALVASGWSAEQLAVRARALKRQDIVALNRWAFLLNGISEPSVFRDDAFREYLRELIPVERFQDLTLPFCMNAVHLETGRTDWFGTGGRLDIPLVDAIYASCALPVFYPPADLEGELYVDGGVRDPLPIQHAAERGADIIIAIDVSAGAVKDSKDTVAKGIVAIHHRVLDIMAFNRKTQILDNWTGPELLYVRPRLDAYSTFDFTRTTHFLEEGYRATRRILDARFGEPEAQHVG
jgi:NTE family protein